MNAQMFAAHPSQFGDTASRMERHQQQRIIPQARLPCNVDVRESFAEVVIGERTRGSVRLDTVALDPLNRIGTTDQVLARGIRIEARESSQAQVSGRGRDGRGP